MKREIPLAKYQETELKLQVANPGDWAAILQLPLFTEASPDNWQRQELEAHYYDTADGRLRQAGLAYRVRRENGQWVATVKGGGSSDGGLHRRQEWNVAAAGPQPDISVFRECSAGQLLVQAVDGSPLLPVLITRFTRTAVQLDRQSCCLEAAADKGEIIAAGSQVPILEIELELKRGETAVLLTTGAELAEQFPLLLEPRSKFARGLELANQAVFEEPAEPDRVRRQIFRLLGMLHAAWSQQRLAIAGPDVAAECIALEQILADGYACDCTDWLAALSAWRQQCSPAVDLTAIVPLLLRLWAWTFK